MLRPSRFPRAYPWAPDAAFLRTFLQLSSLLNAETQSAAQQQLRAAEVSAELGRAMAEDIKSIATQEARAEIECTVMAISSACCASFFAHFGRPDIDHSNALSPQAGQRGSDISAGVTSNSVSALTAMAQGGADGNSTLSAAITDQMQKLIAATDGLVRTETSQLDNLANQLDGLANSPNQPAVSKG
jgi:hypothetical protein